MKLIFSITILFAIPVILIGFLLINVIPLFIQYLFKLKSSEDTMEYPHLTSWEAA